MSMIKEAITRVKAPTPPFWQKIGRLSLALGAVGAALAALPATAAIGTYIVTAAAVAKGLSMMGVEPKDGTLDGTETK